MAAALALALVMESPAAGREARTTVLEHTVTRAITGSDYPPEQPSAPS